jgi:hypothetical protein
LLCNDFVQAGIEWEGGKTLKELATRLLLLFGIALTYMKFLIEKWTAVSCYHMKMSSTSSPCVIAICRQLNVVLPLISKISLMTIKLLKNTFWDISCLQIGLGQSCSLGNKARAYNIVAQITWSKINDNFVIFSKVVQFLVLIY